jgi:hypothetical protein
VLITVSLTLLVAMYLDFNIAFIDAIASALASCTGCWINEARGHAINTPSALRRLQAAMEKQLPSPITRGTVVLLCGGLSIRNFNLVSPLLILSILLFGMQVTTLHNICSKIPPIPQGGRSTPLRAINHTHGVPPGRLSGALGRPQWRLGWLYDFTVQHAH